MGTLNPTHSLTHLMMAMTTCAGCRGELCGRLAVCARLVSVLLARCRGGAVSLRPVHVCWPGSVVSVVVARSHHSGRRPDCLAHWRLLAQGTRSPLDRTRMLCHPPPGTPRRRCCRKQLNGIYHLHWIHPEFLQVVQSWEKPADNLTGQDNSEKRKLIEIQRKYGGNETTVKTLESVSE